MDGDLTFLNKNNSVKSHSSGFIPETNINILRDISERCDGLTFVSGIIIPEYKQKITEDIKIKNNFSLSLNSNNYKVDHEHLNKSINKLNHTSDAWKEILKRNLVHKKNINYLESRKIQFMNNISDLQQLCEHSLSVLKDLESQAKIIEEYIYPYQQYMVLFHKIQNDKLSNNLKEISKQFEIIDNSIFFFQNHTELKHSDHYIENYKKLRIKLCSIVKIFMKNILDECKIKKNDESDFNTENGSQLFSHKTENKINEQNIFLYYTQLRSKGKEFNIYFRLLMNRFHLTNNEIYKSAIEQMEHFYINSRILDHSCGIKTFANLEKKDEYLNTNSPNSLMLNIKNYTRLALSYCKYEWIAYNSFFNCDEYSSKSKNKVNFLELNKFKNELFLENKSLNEKGKNLNEMFNFNVLIDKFGVEYYSKMSSHIKKICNDPEILRESISYLSQDIISITNELYQVVLFPDIYLSTFIHYILKLQNTLIEQLLFTTEIFIKNNIDDYELTLEELNYPEILFLNNANKKIIRSLPIIPSKEVVKQNFCSEYQKNMPEVNQNTPESKIEVNFLSKKLEFETNTHCENELLTNVSFPPNTIRLQTNSDSGEDVNEDEYFGILNDQRNLIKFNSKKKSVDLNGFNDNAYKSIEISTGSFTVVKNCLLGLSYINCIVPTSTYSYLSQLIINKCCAKLFLAKEFINKKLYDNDKISKLYHSNLFMIRNLLYLKYELIIISKQSYSENNDGYELITNIGKLLNSKNADFKLDPRDLICSLENENKYSQTEIILKSIVNIVDVSLNNHLEDLINNICSNICLPLTKIVLQVHPEIQKSDIIELQCTSHEFIKESICCFWKNLKLHMNDYLLRYMNAYLSIAVKEEVETLISSILMPEISIDRKKSNLESSNISNHNCSKSSYCKHYKEKSNKSCAEIEYEKKNLNTAISSIIPNSLSVFLAIKSILLEGVIYEFDHVLFKRLEIEKDIIENDLNWKLSEILNFLNSVETKVREQSIN